MAEKLHARITYLAMTERPNMAAPAPAGIRMAIMRASDMPLHFYRYLYERIGRQHHWMLRRLQTDEELAAIIHSDKTEIHILYVNGCPAGFVEIDISKLPERAEIVYFGLISEYQGRGLGRFFLSEAVANAWAHGPEKVTISTNSLDSPYALQLYQKIGFTPIGWSEEEVEPWH